MNIDPQDVVAIYEEIKRERGPLMQHWQMITELADGNITIPLPEQDKHEQATTVNLFSTGLDSFATRAASVQPDQYWAPLRDGFDKSELWSRQRREAGLGWWDMNDMTIKDYQRFRYYFGYGSTPVSLSPVGMSDKRDIPHWRIHNPICSFPAPSTDPLDIEPPYAVFVTTRSRKWLSNNYPAQLAAINSGPADRRTDTDLFELLEYQDCDETVLVLCGRKNQGTNQLWTPYGQSHGSAAELLERCVNRAGIPLIVFPGRITLHQIQGQLDQMAPAYYKAAKLDAMNYLAVKQQVFPEKWLVSHPGDPQQGEIIIPAIPEIGQIGEVVHGSIQPIGPQVGTWQMVTQAVDQSERTQRIIGGIPAEMNGEGGTNIRTATRGQMILGSAIDTKIQEAQEIMQISKEAELQRGAAIMTGWFGGKKTSFYIPKNGKLPKFLDYTPDEAFGDSDQVDVKYSMAGTDANSIVVRIGQEVNIGLMSEQTGREMDPAIEDPIKERDLVELEGLRRALLTGLEQQAQQGMLGPDQIAMIAKLKWSSHENLEDVVLKVHEQMQQKQAENQQAPAGSPQTQPGLNAGNGPAAPPQAGGSPVQAGAPNLAQLMGNLKGGGAPPGSTQMQNPQPPQNALAQ